MKFTTGYLFCKMIFPKVQKDVDGKGSKNGRLKIIKLWADRSKNETWAKMTFENGMDISGTNYLDLQKLTEGAIGQIMLKKAEKIAPGWVFLGASADRETSIVDLVFYDKNRNKIDSVTF